MQKLIFFAAALSIGSVALAQNQPAQQEPTEPTEEAQMAPEAAQPPANAPAGQMPMQPSGNTVSDPSQSTGPQGITQQGTDPDGQATPPVGTNQPPQMMSPGMTAPSQGAAFTPRAAASEYPPCSRTVTDGCIQTYERGVRAARRRR
jgi:hypothetical protein